MMLIMMKKKEEEEEKEEEQEEEEDKLSLCVRRSLLFNSTRHFWYVCVWCWKVDLEWLCLQIALLSFFLVIVHH
jgi:hypothetical protein